MNPTYYGGCNRYCYHSGPCNTCPGESVAAPVAKVWPLVTTYFSAILFVQFVLQIWCVFQMAECRLDVLACLVLMASSVTFILMDIKAMPHKKALMRVSFALFVFGNLLFAAGGSWPNSILAGIMVLTYFLYEFVSFEQIWGKYA